MAVEYSTADYHRCLLASIEKVKDLATGKTLDLNRSQCVLLSEGLLETASFLQRDDVKPHFLRCGSTCRWRTALPELYSVVKQAYSLVLQCCESEGSTLPARALCVFAMDYYVLDILVHLRWWTAILTFLIVPEREMSELECLRCAIQEFEENLKSSNVELHTAAEIDRGSLLDTVNVLLQAHSSQYGIEPDDDYLLLFQVHALLTNEEHSISEMDKYTMCCSNEGENPFMGNGGSGVVHSVRWCGIRCVHKQYCPLKPADIEVDSLKRFHHPHIVRFFHHWKNDKSHILMERMERNLQQLIESEQGGSGHETQPFKEPVAIDIMLQVIKAIWHMHNTGVVHRDLKPQNVLVRRLRDEGEVPERSDLGHVEVKLGDFGNAKENMMTSNAEPLTYKSGTQIYRAPELSSKAYTGGNRNFPHKIDMWSFGIMCSQILTGKQPFQGIGLEGNNALLEHIKMGGRPSIDDCPDYLRICIKSCWEYDPQKRPRSLEMWRMLRVAQLRSLGLIDQNYDLFEFKNRYNQVVPRTPAKSQRMIASVLRWIVKKQNIF